MVGLDGKPEIGARVAVRDAEFNGPPQVKQTDNQGFGEMPVFEGRAYSVGASKLMPRDQPDCVEQVDVTVEHNPKPIRIQVDCEGKSK